MNFTNAVLNGSESYITFSCTDENGNAYTPSSLEYSVWDLTNGINVVTPTVITAAQSGTFTLTSTVNTMNSASGSTESRQVNVKTGIPGGTFRNDVLVYTLVRKMGTP